MLPDDGIVVALVSCTAVDTWHLVRRTAAADGPESEPIGGGMQPEFLDRRVEILERTMEGLSELPGRMEKVEVQIVQLRTEMHDEYSAIRREMRKGDDDTREFMRALNEETRSELRVVAEGVSDARAQLTALSGRTGVLEAGFSLLRVETAALRTDVAELKTDFAILKTDVGVLRTDMHGLRTEFSTFRAEVTQGLSTIQEQLRARS
jgi:chromosome segregation ATPase